MRLNTPYYPIPGSQPEGTFGAILEMLLRARLDLQMDSNIQLYDEDVNAYLGGVLVSYIDPKYLLAISEVLSKYDVDVYQAVVRAGVDRVQTYRIYKINADDLLVSLGIFCRLWQEQKSEVIRIKRYYTCASECQKRIYGKSTAVAEIQAKLAEGTERYLAILSQARKDYLRFMEQIGSEQLTDLAQRVEREFPIRKKQDELLDAYSAWVKQPEDLEARQRLLRVAEELKQVDPTFQLDTILSQLNFPPPLTP